MASDFVARSDPSADCQKEGSTDSRGLKVTAVNSVSTAWGAGASRGRAGAGARAAAEGLPDFGGSEQRPTSLPASSPIFLDFLTLL